MSKGHLLKSHGILMVLTRFGWNLFSPGTVERLQHIVTWFDKYLQGKKIDSYDVP